MLCAVRAELSSIVCLSLIAGFLSFIPKASACSCAMPGSPAEEYEQSAAVFLGTPFLVKADGEWGNKVYFTVQKFWKNPGQRTVVVYTGSNSALCGYEFSTTGERYLVYARKDAAGNLSTDICGRTVQESNAGEDLAFLKSLESTPGPAPSPVFHDVPLSHPSAAAIAFVHAKEVVKGYPDGTFRPSQTINRAEFAAMIARAIAPAEEIDGCPLTADFSYALSDVPSGSWFEGPVCLLRVKGAIQGYADRTYRPHSTIRLEEAAKIIVTVYGYPTGTGMTWYGPYILALRERDALPAGTAVGQPITRAQMAEILYSLFAG